MRTSEDIGERFPETSAHLLAMQRFYAREIVEEVETAKRLALPTGLTAIYRGEIRHSNGRVEYRFELR